MFYTATTLNHIGALYRDLGEHQKALDYFSQALQLRRTIGDRKGEAATLSHIARLERDRGNLVEARNRIEAALAAVESLRANIASQQLRVSFFASVRQYHEFNIDLLMRLHKQRPSEGFDALALQASEKSRARSLLVLLTEARAEIRQGVDPALLERERALRQMISDKADRQMQLLSGKHTEEQATAAAKEIDALTTDYEQVEANIRQTSPRYAAEELVRQLQSEQQHLAQLQEELSKPSQSRPIIASLMLLPGLPRSSANLPKLIVTREAQQARLQIGLEKGDDHKRFHVELRTAVGQVIWSQNDLPARAARAGRSVILYLPVSVLSAGEYELALKGVTDKEEVEDLGYYYFSALKK